MKIYFLIFNILFLCSFSNVLSISIQDNAYSGITISISDQVEESSIIDNYGRLKGILEKSSEFFYEASRNRAYFKEFVIAIPSTWSDHYTKICKVVTNPPEKVDIYISNSPRDLQAQHSKGCGQEGDIIHMPLTWIGQGKVKDRAREFVQEWSTYRYGVFEEVSFENDACYRSPNKHWSPVGCYNVKIQTNVTISEDDGLPRCSLLEEDVKNSKSSLMFKTNISEAMNFCDGSEDYPHNPVMPTLHNNLCDGKTVWSVIENSDDFKHGKNLAALINKTKPSFMCYKENGLQLTLVVQNINSTNIRKVVTELRFSLYHFMKNLIPKETSLNLVVFSEDGPELFSEIKAGKDEEVIIKYLAANVKKPPRLLDGIIMALDNSKSVSKVPMVVIIALESAVLNVSEYIKEIQKHPKVQVNFILIEDTENGVITDGLANAVRYTGGSMYSLPKPYRPDVDDDGGKGANILLSAKLNAILSTLVKTPLEVEDKITLVHEAVYKKEGPIKDTFLIPPVTKGTLIYLMHCDFNGQISIKSHCSKWDEKLVSYFMCEKVIDLNGTSATNFTQEFEVRKEINLPLCNSVAFLSDASYLTQNNFISIRGWLSDYIITAGENALIIYAEIIGSIQKENMIVIAEITGPDMDVPIEIELRDNGNGDPDTKSGDGIYSRYFTSFDRMGTYVVQVSVKVTTPRSSSIFKNDPDSAYPEGMQKKVIASFSVTSKPPSVDIIPPNRVGDLRVVRIDHENRTATLEWTAPGNDYDNGTAMKYEIKSATQAGSLKDPYFDSDETTKQNSPEKPQHSGTNENYDLMFPKTYQDTVIYIALRAEDGLKNRANVSNIVQVFLEKSENPESSSTVQTNLTEITSTTDDGINTTLSIISSTISVNNTGVISERSWKELLSDTKFIIIVSSAGGLLLLLILIIIIVCCCLFKKKNKPRKITKKSSLRPPYNLNVTFQQDTQSENRSISAISDSFSDSDYWDQQGSVAEAGEANPNPSPRYAFHTSKSISDKTKHQNGTAELGFKLVDTIPASTTRAMPRLVKRLKENVEETVLDSSVAQPQQPPKNNETQIYSLGEV